jgi:hypothetical protein
VKATGNFRNKSDEETLLETEWKPVLEELGRRCKDNIKTKFKNYGLYGRIHAGIRFGVLIF